MNSTTTSTHFPISTPWRDWSTVRAAVWIWRTPIMRPVRWFRRNFWKICIWIISLVTLIWQYESWHGRTELAEQQALWKADFGEFKYTSHEVPDDQNFFAAPVFEKMSFGPNCSADPAYSKAVSDMPHHKFLLQTFPSIKLVDGGVNEIFDNDGSSHLDVAGWAAAQTTAGKVRPEGLSDAAWLHASMPQDDTIDGLVEALQRPESAMIPSAAERMAVGDKMGSRIMTPIPAWSNVFEGTQAVFVRARVAALAGDGQRAEELIEIGLRFAEAGTYGSSLVELLITMAIQGQVGNHLPEIISSRALEDSQLKRLASRLARIDEEKGTRHSLLTEAHWGQEIKMSDLTRNPLRHFLPAAWLDANKANMLKWWRFTLTPDVPGDDLVYFASKMREGIPRWREETIKFPTPRTFLAGIASPALTNVLNSALENQIRRRQALAAIGMERYYLRYQKYPTSLSELVPSFLEQIPGDPWKPGTALTMKLADNATSYDIISEGKTQHFQ